MQCLDIGRWDVSIRRGGHRLDMEVEIICVGGGTGFGRGVIDSARWGK